MLKTYSSLKEGQLDVFLRNWNSEIRRLATKFHADAVVKIGIFWYLDGKFYSEVEPWTSKKLSKVPGFVSYDIIHFDVWKKKQIENPELQNISWTDIPRGRIWFENGSSIVELATELDTPEMHAAIIKEFNLPPEKTKEPSGDRRTVFFPFKGYDKNIGKE